ncbi:methylmalonyl-CoA mutase family protein [Formosa sp. S-31]|uniref:methylmalonyl-CoA mutase family protein n=1 Tax=Formosa sp. S-31 TaxID=2790949 RepID=UPI003EBF2E06
MSTQNNTLFSDFTPVSKQEWLEKVNIDLKGADFNKKLVWKTLNGVAFQPYYNQEDQLQPLPNTGENVKAFINYRTIPVTSAESANQAALKAIEEGLTGLIFELTTPVEVDELLQNIDLNTIALAFEMEPKVLKFASAFFNYAQEHLSHPENLRGYFDLKLISDYVSHGGDLSDKFEALKALITLGKDYPNFKTLSVSGTNFLDAGGNQVQEIAYTLSAVVFVLNNLLEDNKEAETIFNDLNVQLAIGSEYFVEIGKFRAFNSLLNEVAKEFGVTEFKHTVTAKTSVWSKSVTDAETNLLRATTEAMSALLGNVDGILIDPFDKEFKETSGFSNRIAGNIATILREESYFGKVANPVDGSFYIEEVSAKIAGQALVLFKAVEDQGGFYKAFENEYIQEQIAEIRQTKIKLLSQRRLAMVGVNKYPNLMETLDSDVLSSGVESSKYLTPRRAALEIETLRKVTEDLVQATNSRPVVELTGFGNLAMRKARAGFAYDFLGVSGFEVWQEKSYNTVDEAVEASANSASQVVVICSSDQDYEDSALSFVEKFRAINKDKVLLLAGNPVSIIEGLTQAGLDGCIHLKSDVITSISGVQNKVKQALKVH